MKNIRGYMYYTATCASPIGNLTALASETALVGLDFSESERMNEKIVSLASSEGIKQNPEIPIIRETMHQLREYFEGTRKIFSLPLDLEGTPFQKRAWNALQQIPYGETLSYMEEARAIGNLKAVRAVGGANNKNPIVIVIPCHRVIGSDGRLVGYGGGIDRKRWLLDHEKHNT